MTQTTHTPRTSAPAAARVPHQVGGVPGAATARPKTDLERLVDYIEGPFITTFQALRQLNRSVKQVKTQENLTELVIDAQDFFMEVSMWAPEADRLYAEALSNAEKIESAAAAERQETTGRRESVQTTRDAAKAEVGAVKAVVKQLEEASRAALNITYQGRTYLERLTTDEGLANLAAQVDVPEARFSAPIGAALARHVRNT